jgi:hypothetical protein
MKKVKYPKITHETKIAKDLDNLFSECSDKYKKDGLKGEWTMEEESHDWMIIDDGDCQVKQCRYCGVKLSKV